MTDPVTLKTAKGDFQFPVLEGSCGPDVFDVRKLYGTTGMFTYDPGFTSTASFRTDKNSTPSPTPSRATRWCTSS